MSETACACNVVAMLWMESSIGRYVALAQRPEQANATVDVRTFANVNRARLVLEPNRSAIYFTDSVSHRVLPYAC